MKDVKGDLLQKRIEAFLNDKTDVYSRFDQKTLQELLQQINIYHQELIYQNDEMKRIQKEIEVALERSEDIFEQAPVGYLIVNSNWEILKVNDALASMVKHSCKDLVGTDIRKLIHRDAQNDFYFYWRDLWDCKNFKCEEETLQMELTLLSSEDIKTVCFYANLDQNNHEKISRIAVVDISKEREYLSEMKYLSFHDHLTGLYNRRYFDEERVRLDVKRNLPIGVIMADLNGLKFFNDTFGHKVGDEILMLIADTLKNTCRVSEIIARFGGDEFAILLPGTGEKEVEQLVRRLERAVGLVRYEGLPLTMAFGYAVKKEEQIHFNDIIKDAEDMMYKNKIMSEESHRKELVDSIIKVLYTKHEQEEEHTEKVQRFAEKLALASGQDNEVVDKIKLASLLHDIGKIAISKELLIKKDPLTDDDLYEIKRHSEVGYKILKSVRSFREVAEIVYYHHEWVNGTGYPCNLSGKNIPIESRIIAIAEAFEAMTTNRPYREACTQEEAMEELQRFAGKQFDAELVDCFIEKVLPIILDKAN